jgi:hypothetical protein
MKFLYVLFVLSLLIVEAKPQTTASGPKRTVAGFMNAWLVKKNFTQARRYFSAKAFSNKLILSDDCAGYIHEEDRVFPKRVEQQVMKFLRDFAFATSGTSLKTILVFDDGPPENIGQINSSSKDGYILLHMGRNDITDDDEEWSYLKSKFPSREFLVLIVTLKTKDGEGTLGFHWAKEGSRWKIIHIGMQCT